LKFGGLFVGKVIDMLDLSLICQLTGWVRNKECRERKVVGRCDLCEIVYGENPNFNCYEIMKEKFNNSNSSLFPVKYE
jgi:hypothetical protein